MRSSRIRLMEVCGTHTMAIARCGIKDVLPGDVELISGPGCPVCVTAQGDIDRAVALARRPDVIMTTFGDMMRVPGSGGSLEEQAGQGADIRMVYSCLDALGVARDNPQKQVIFVGVGFETTSPTVAATILQARKERIRNFYVLSYFKLIFPAMAAIAGSRKAGIDGFICPGHVSVITGSRPYEAIARRYKKPCVITGFDPADIIRGIRRLTGLIRNKKHQVEIEYTRAVRKAGNTKAQGIIQKVFLPGDAEWRGLGVIKASGLRFRKAYEGFDAAKAFPAKIKKPRPKKGCLCGEVLQGIKAPADCRLFAAACTPQTPVGPCMVSSEGACAAYYRYGRRKSR